MKKVFISQKFFLLLSFFLPFLVFLRTLSPTVNFGDSGELIVSAYTLGIPHPPGFPLWNLLAKPFTFLPIKTIAYRVNLSSAVFAALTTYFLFKTLLLLYSLVLKKSKNRLLIFTSSLFSVLTLAFSYTFWQVSVVTEVYALASLFVVLTLFCFLKFLKTSKTSFLFLFSFLLGAGVCVHYLSLPLIPAFFISWLFFGKMRRKISALPLSFLLFLLGLSFFLYLPIRSRANPPIDWGNPENLAAFLNVVKRRQFSPFDQASIGVSLPIKRSASILDIFKRVFSSGWAYLHILGGEFSVVGFLLGFLGLIACFRKNFKTSLILLLGFLFSGYGYAFAVSQNKPSLPTSFDTYLPSFLYFSCFLSFGFWAVSDFLLKKLPTQKRIVFLLPAVLPLFLLFRNFKTTDFSQNKVALYHAQNILKTAGDNSIIFAEENNWIFPLLYLVAAEGEGRDITIYDRNANLFEDVYQKAKKSIVEEVWEAQRNKIEEELIEKTSKNVFYAADKRFENYKYKDATTAGILYQRGAAEPIKVDFAKEYANILEIEKVNFYDDETYYIIAHYHLQYAEDLKRQGRIDEALKELEKAYYFGRLNTPFVNNLAVMYFNLGKLDLAIKLCEETLTLTSAPHLTFITHRNLGKLYEKKGRFEEAEREYKEALKIKPTFVSAILSLSDLKLKQGEILIALKGYQKALLVNPEDQLAKAKILKVLKEKSEGNEKIFVGFLEGFLKGASRETEFYLEYGRLLIKMGQTEEARAIFEKILQKKPEFGEQIEEIWQEAGLNKD